jgi:diketogulonate reductase-like aldo/keto reductase
MMRFKQLGRTGEKIPEIGIGTWKMGGRAEEEIDAIREGIRLGMGLVDTAEMYANEVLVGEAVEGRRAFMATKVSPQHFRYDSVISSCKASLERLGLAQIDLYQLHWPNNSVPIAETMSAMEHLVDTGMIRHIGVSNFSVEELEEAQAAMKKYEIVSNQVEYSILVREIEEELLGYCQKSGITIIAYSPLARGAVFDKGAQQYGTLGRIAERRGKSIGQVALNWVVSKRGVVAIPKASDIGHLRDNAGGSGWKLSRDEIAEISGAAVRKRSMSAAFKPVMSNYGAVSDAYSRITKIRNWKLHLRRRTTKSSKK